MDSLASKIENRFKELFWALASLRLKGGASKLSAPGQRLSLLVLRPDRLGDFILSAPALRELLDKTGNDIDLTIVTGERNRTIAHFLFPRARLWTFPKFFLSRLVLFMRLWLGRFDLVVDFHSFPFSTTSALMALLSGSPCRVGFWDTGKYGELSRKIFNWGVPPPPLDLHEREKSLRLVKRLHAGAKMSRSFPVPAIPVSVRARVESFYAALNLKKGERVIGLHPTLQKVDNRWQQENYFELVRKFRKARGFKLVIVHGRGEGEELARFLEGLGEKGNVFVLPEDGVLFILEACKKLDLFVGNDSGLAHLAALVTRVLVIFGPSEPSRWSPLDTGHGKPKILRKKDRFCDSVTPGEVVKEIRKTPRR